MQKHHVGKRVAPPVFPSLQTASTDNLLLLLLLSPNWERKSAHNNPTNHGIVRCNFFHSIQVKKQSNYRAVKMAKCRLKRDTLFCYNSLTEYLQLLRMKEKGGAVACRIAIMCELCKRSVSSPACRLYGIGSRDLCSLGVIYVVCVCVVLTRHL